MRGASLALALLLAACGTTVHQGGSTASTDAQLGGGSSLAASADPTAPAVAATHGGRTDTSRPEMNVPPAESTGPTSASQQASAGAGLPPAGPGWDRRFVYIGVVTNQDIQHVAQTIGVNSLDSGDQKADAESMIADLNARGGLFGRQVKAYFFDVKSTTDADTNGQAACAFFTQDHHVVAVLNRVLQDDTPSFRTCMEKAHTMVLAGGTQALTDAGLDAHHGWYVHLTVPTWDRLAPLLVRRLSAQHYFTGWNTAAGSAAPQPVKLGIVAPDNADTRAVVKILAGAFSRAGHPPADEVFYADQQSLQAAVLRFRSDGITHVVDTDEFVFLFMQNAESQDYRPRYAINTLNGPALLLQGIVPPRQLGGSVGLGWAPTFDVDGQHNVDPPGARVCEDVMRKRGPQYDEQKRYAHAYFFYYCDATRLLAAAAVKAGGLAPDQIREGVRLVADGLQPAFTFSNALAPGMPAVPGTARDLEWSTACTCYRYAGSPWQL
jgi:hypothetical protein